MQPNNISKRSRHPPNFYSETAKKRYGKQIESEPLLFEKRRIKSLREKVMTILAAHMQYNRNAKPLHQDYTHIGENDFIFLKKKFNLNGRFRQSSCLEESLSLLKKNFFGDDFIEIGNIWFRLKKGKTFTVTLNKKENFWQRPTLIIKFVRIR